MASTFRGRRARTSCRASSRRSRCRPSRTNCPTAHAGLLAAARTLERAGRDVQDIEFTIERGQLFFLQSRSAKLAPHAAARIAVDLVREGLDRRGRSAPPHHARSGQDPACASHQSLRRFTAPTLSPPARALRLASASAFSLATPTRPSGARKRERLSFLPARPRARTTCTA